MMPVTRGRSRFVLALVLCAAPLASCKDSSGPPEERVSTLEVAGGDGQGAAVATALTQPLVVRALDAEGRPVRGARIDWRVMIGGGTVTPLEEVTDGEGRASATWVLGTATGQQNVTAAVGTFSATFVATAIAGPAASITLDPAAVALDAIGATVLIRAGIRDVHGNAIEARAPTWTTTDATVVSVSQGGVALALAPGSARIRATLDGASGEAQVTVQPQPSRIDLSPPAAQLDAIGATVQFQAAARDRNGNPIALSPQAFTWTTSSAAVISAGTTGLVTAVGAGTAQVRATIGSVTGQAQVTVSPAVASLVVGPRIDTLTTARPAVQLTVVARDANNQPIAAPSLVWTTSSAAVATVSPAGFVAAVANGSAVIRVTSGAVSDSARITVRLNTPPKPVPDSLATLVDTPLARAAPGLLANDTLGIPAATLTSFGGGSLLGTVTSNPAGATVTFGTGGSLRVSADGSLAFVPSAGFNGSFTFVYRLQNVAGASDVTVTIAVGMPPAAVDDAYSTTRNTALTLATPGVMANDDRGFPLAAVTSFGGGDIGGTVTTYPPGQLVAFGGGGFVGGQLRLNGDGSLSLTPPTGFTGTITFQYRLANGLGAADATVTITVVPPPAPFRPPD